MTTSLRTRRDFMRASLAAAAASPLAPYLGDAWGRAQAPRSPNDRPHVAVIGMRYQGSVIAEKAKAHGDLVAFCDADRHVREMAKACFGSTQKIYEDYRPMLDDKSIDVVLIGSPDHWHAKMAIDAMKAGKDVYVEKPLTLTIDEGKAVRKAAAETGRVVQVGSWQRSDINFRLASELVRAGRLGRIRRVTAVAGENPAGGPFAPAPVPANLNWDLWLGPAPKVGYVPERCHYTFRWWWDYAGGKLTDWGAHHLDIIQWALGEQNSGPVGVEGKGTFPKAKGGYEVPTKFAATFTYASGVEVEARDAGENGIRFEGDKGWLFVERGKIRGTAIDALKDDPLRARPVYVVRPRPEGRGGPHAEAGLPRQPHGELLRLRPHPQPAHDLGRGEPAPQRDGVPPGQPSGAAGAEAGVGSGGRAVRRRRRGRRDAPPRAAEGVRDGRVRAAAGLPRLTRCSSGPTDTPLMLSSTPVEQFLPVAPAGPQPPQQHQLNEAQRIHVGVPPVGSTAAGSAWRPAIPAAP